MVCSRPNLIPELTISLMNLQGNLFDAQQIFYQQLPLLKFILKGACPQLSKAGLKLLGVDTGVPVLP